jgi:hypothetical protein
VTLVTFPLWHHSLAIVIKKFKTKQKQQLRWYTTISKKNCCEKLCYSLALFFKFSFEKLFSQGLVEVFKTGSSSDPNNYQPVFKTGSSSDPNNYQPIPLTSIMCKTTESITKISLYSILIPWD